MNTVYAWFSLLLSCVLIADIHRTIGHGPAQSIGNRQKWTGWENAAFCACMDLWISAASQCSNSII